MASSYGASTPRVMWRYERRPAPCCCCSGTVSPTTASTSRCTATARCWSAGRRSAASDPSGSPRIDQPELVEDAELVPVLPQRADSIAPELGNRRAVECDRRARGIENLAAREREGAGMRHRDGPLRTCVIAADVERRDIQIDARERIVAT